MKVVLGKNPVYIDHLSMISILIEQDWPQPKPYMTRPIILEYLADK